MTLFARFKYLCGRAGFCLLALLVLFIFTWDNGGFLHEADEL